MSTRERTFEGRQQWLAWRQGGIGSSDATILAATAGLVEPPKWVSPHDDQALYWDKLGRGKPKADTAAMRRGRDLEEDVRAMVERELGFIAPANLEREDAPFLRASFDGLTLDEAIVEIKVPNRTVIEMAAGGEVVGYYAAQLAHQFMVLHGHPEGWAGDELAHFVVYDHEQQRLHRVEVRSERLRGLALDLWKVEEAFWRHVQQREPLKGGKAWAQLAEAIVEVKRREQLAEQLRKRLRWFVEGGYEPQAFSVRHTKPSVRKRIDWAAVMAEARVDEARLAAFRSPPSWAVSLPPLPEPAEEAWLDADEVERELLALDGLEDELEPLLLQARGMAADLKTTLVGPDGLTVAQRQGRVRYEEAAKALGLPQSLIDAHTSMTATEGGITLVRKKQVAQAA